MMVNTDTGEILDLTRLSKPPRRTRHNRPVKRQPATRYKNVYPRRCDRETIFTLSLVTVIAVGLLLFQALPFEAVVVGM